MTSAPKPPLPPLNRPKSTMDRILDLLKRWFAAWRKWPTWAKWASAVIALGLIVGPFVSNDDGEASNSGTQSTATASTQTGASPTTSVSSSIGVGADVESATSATTSSPVELPEFTIIEQEDVSFPGAVRISLRVAVEEGVTPSELSALGYELAARYRESHGYQAFNIFFYHFPELAFDVASLGIWIDAPFGDWSRAADAARGDYSEFAVDEQLFEKDWELVPTVDDIALYQAFNEKFDELDTDALSFPDDDIVAQVVAEEAGVSVDDVFTAYDAIFTWIFNGR